MKRMSLRDEKGAAVVEFAVVAVLVLAIVFGIIEFGILMFDKHVLTNASREGARVGIVMRVPRVSNNDIQDIIRVYAEEHMVGLGSSNALDFGPWPDEDPWILPAEASRTGNLFGADTVLQVTVKYPFDFLVLSSFGMGPITLEAQTRMRME